MAFRRIHELNSSDIEVVAINDLTTPSMLAYLLKYDSTHGKFPGEVSAYDEGIIVDGKKYPVYAERDAKNIPWVRTTALTSFWNVLVSTLQLKSPSTLGCRC